VLSFLQGIETLETDVLVLGGGVAGHRAAAAVRGFGQRALMAHVAHGASPFLLGCNAPLGTNPDADSADAYFKDVVEAGGQLNDPRLVRALASHAVAAFQDLEALGVPFARDSTGVLLRHLSGNSRPRSFYVPEGTGRAILQQLAAHCRRVGVETWPGWQALVLLTDEGRVVGALLAKRATGEIRAVLARAVVLATGGIGRLYQDSTYPADVTSDSCALAYRAGATLIDMEFVQFEPTIIVHPEACRGMEIPTAMLGDGAHLLNAREERFMFRYNPVHGERLIEKARLALCIQQEIDAGRGLPDGAVWVDTTVVPREKLEGYVSHCRRLRAAGLDPAAERPRIRPAAHSHMGGVQIDAEGGTGVPGLYAGGEAAGGVHGASRIAGNGGADALVFGALAGKGAAISAMSSRKPRAPRHALDEGATVLGSLVRGLGRTDSQEILGIIQRTMSQNVGLRRHRDGLAAAASLLSDLERSLEGEESPADVPVPAFFAGLSARNMLLTARMITQAALLRTESRGAHQRTDFPLRDDAHWLRHIAFRAGPTGDLRAETIPVD